MLKNILFLPLFLFLIFIKAQTNDFPYNQQWGTYVGGTGSVFQNSNNFAVDSQKNLYVNGTTNFITGYTANYYNQFATGGGNSVDFSLNYNAFSSQFSSSGILQKSGYISSGNFGNSYTQLQILIGIDKLDNKYYAKYETGQISNLSTPNVWLAQSTDLTKNYTQTLSKYDVNNNLIWTTYLPNESQNSAFLLRFDDANNLYLSELTGREIPGFSTPNVFQENYFNYGPAITPSNNSYLVKLNAAGQKVWGTYVVAGIEGMEIYDGNIYTYNTYQAGMPANLTTAGTFQPTITAQQLLMKFDCATGNKQWGTFYGTNTSIYPGLGIYDLEVNETGLYVSGQTIDDLEPTYFSSADAYKNQLTGGGDLFLSKFDYTGNRDWSTYFGSDGYEDIIGSQNLTILGDRIIFTGSQLGNAHNISTTNAFSTTPYNSGSTLNSWNNFFTEFDSSGGRKWTSYFGGFGGNHWGEQANPELLSDGSLILWGVTGAPTGIATTNGAYPTMTNPSPNQSFGFVTKFALKVPLSTSEINETNDLQLVNNPNNGNFAITGGILEKEKTSIKIYDISGRLLESIPLKKQKKHQFNLENKLAKGNYLIELNSENGKKIKVFKMFVNK